MAEDCPEDLWKILRDSGARGPDAIGVLNLQTYFERVKEKQISSANRWKGRGLSVRGRTKQMNGYLQVKLL